MACNIGSHDVRHGVMHSHGDRICADGPSICELPASCLQASLSCKSVDGAVIG